MDLFIETISGQRRFIKTISGHGPFYRDNIWTWTFLQGQFLDMDLFIKTISGHGPFNRDNFWTWTFLQRQFLDMGLFIETIFEVGIFRRDNFYKGPILAKQCHIQVYDTKRAKRYSYRGLSGMLEQTVWESSRLLWKVASVFKTGSILIGKILIKFCARSCNHCDGRVDEGGGAE